MMDAQYISLAEIKQILTKRIRIEATADGDIAVLASAYVDCLTFEYEAAKWEEKTYVARLASLKAKKVPVTEENCPTPKLQTIRSIKKKPKSNLSLAEIEEALALTSKEALHEQRHSIGQDESQAQEDGGSGLGEEG